MADLVLELRSFHFLAQPYCVSLFTGCMRHIILTSFPLGHWSFSVNTQSWQCWHFCTSNGNELEVVANEINFTANLHYS